jgi:hypothetical protein
VPSSASTAAEREFGTLAWVGPFAVFMLWLVLDEYIPLANPLKEIVRDVVILASIVGFSGRLLATHARVNHWLASIALGVAVCAMWVAPDVLVPGWRESILFQNDVTGRLKTSIPARRAHAADAGPAHDARGAPGAGARGAVLARLAAALAAEHALRARPARTVHAVRLPRHRRAVRAGARPVLGGGAALRLIYNWWMWRTRSLGDLILVHAVTNLVLSAFAIATQRWTLWM